MKSSRTWIHVLRLKGGKPTYSQKNRDLLQWHKACDSIVESLRHFTWTRVKTLKAQNVLFQECRVGLPDVSLLQPLSFFFLLTPFLSNLSCSQSQQAAPASNIQSDIGCSGRRWGTGLHNDNHHIISIIIIIIIKEHFIIYFYIAFICGFNYHMLRFFCCTKSMV